MTSMNANRTPRERLNDDAIFLASKQFSEWVLDGDIYEVSYANDPPWDHSGTLIKQKSTESERLSKYATLGEWMEDCHTGQSTASFESGCGFYHDTYSAEIQDDVRSICEKLLMEERGIDPKSEDAVELVADDAVDLWIQACEAVEKVSVDLAWEIGRFPAASAIY